MVLISILCRSLVLIDSTPAAPDHQFEKGGEVFDEITKSAVGTFVFIIALKKISQRPRMTCISIVVNKLCWGGMESLEIVLLVKKEIVKWENDFWNSHLIKHFKLIIFYFKLDTL